MQEKKYRRPKKTDGRAAEKERKRQRLIRARRQAAGERRRRLGYPYYLCNAETERVEDFQRMTEVQSEALNARLRELGDHRRWTPAVNTNSLWILQSLQHPFRLAGDSTPAGDRLHSNSNMNEGR